MEGYAKVPAKKYEPRVKQKSNSSESTLIEHDRRLKIARKRRNTPCRFQDGISYQEFQQMAHSVRKRLKRINKITIEGAKIECVVESQTGVSEWKFVVDFNDWGHITGAYWMGVENYDSSIPEKFGRDLSEQIKYILSNKHIVLPRYADAVDSNEQLVTENVDRVHIEENIFRKIFPSAVPKIRVSYNQNQLLRNHLYPVISLLKNNGFTNIVSIPVNDIVDDSPYYLYEVDYITIGSVSNFNWGQEFPRNVPVKIFYHMKKAIMVDFSERALKGKSYVYVEELLREKGFTNIEEQKVEDLVVGLLAKNGAVISVEQGTESPIKKGIFYPYDVKLVITYHGYKSRL